MLKSVIEKENQMKKVEDNELPVPEKKIKTKKVVKQELAEPVVENKSTEAAIDQEPIYFAPKRVSLVSDISGILSWVVLVGFLAYFVVEIVYLQAQMKAGSLVFSTIIKEPSFISYLFSNMVIPLLTGLGLFVILQAAATVLNVLLDMDYNKHDAGNQTKA
jgi:hypothetical protein